MACIDCPDLNGSIGDCPPFANRADVISALQKVQSSCCVGEMFINSMSPTISDAAAIQATDEAFPDGFDNCYCPCKYIVDETNDKIYMNCTDDLYESDNWHDISESCLSYLTTVGLDPEVSPIESVVEGWPNTGLSGKCQTAILFDEAGNLCYTTDNGTSFSCIRTAVRNLAYLDSQFGNQFFCSGCPSCGGGGNIIMNVAIANPNIDAQIVSNVLNNEYGNAVLACAICPRGLRYDFKVPYNGYYRFDFNFDYIGNFALGSSGCAGCGLTGTTSGTLRLINSAGTVMKSWPLAGKTGTADKTVRTMSIEMHLDLVSAEEYAFSVSIAKIPTLCCSCSPSYDVRGLINMNSISFEFIGG